MEYILNFSSFVKHFWSQIKQLVILFSDGFRDESKIIPKIIFHMKIKFGINDTLGKSTRPINFLIILEKFRSSLKKINSFLGCFLTFFQMIYFCSNLSRIINVLPRLRNLENCRNS